MTNQLNEIIHYGFKEDESKKVLMINDGNLRKAVNHLIQEVMISIKEKFRMILLLCRIILNLYFTVFEFLIVLYFAFFKYLHLINSINKKS